MKRILQSLPLILILLMTKPVYAEQWLDEFDLSRYQNKVVYLDFWASWCGPCRKSFPWLNSMQEKYREKGLVVIAINLDTEFDRAALFIKKVPVNFLLFADPESQLANKFKLEGLPSSFILSGDGKVQGQHVGFKQNKIGLYEEDIVKLLNQLAMRVE